MTERPNILLIICHDLGRELGCYGRSVQTPGINRLAGEGVRFDRAYTTCALCSPARVSLFTGLYPHAHGVRTNTESPALWPTTDLPESIPTLPRLLADYRCGYVGKWHCGETRNPERFGFTEGPDPGPGYGNPYAAPEFEAFLRVRGLAHPAAFLCKGGLFAAAPEGVQAVPGCRSSGGRLPGPAEACEPAYVADWAIRLLREMGARARRKQHPFFLTVSFWGPHHPCYVPEPYASMYAPADVALPASFRDDFAGKPAIHRRWRRSFYREQAARTDDDWRTVIALYWGYCAFVDAEIGRLLSALDAEGLRDDTAVAFTSDHGDMMGGHGLFDKGEFMYEDAYRIPLVVRAPGRTLPGAVCRSFVANMDLMPTILDLAGVAPPAGLHARSLAPLLADPAAAWRDDLMAEFHGLRVGYNQRMVRWGDWKYVCNSPDTDELYDLASDPHELRNRLTDPVCAGAAAEGRQRLLHWMKETHDPLHGSAWQQLNFGV
jgi:arylsulfatase A-like enzyme